MTVRVRPLSLAGPLCGQDFMRMQWATPPLGGTDAATWLAEDILALEDKAVLVKELQQFVLMRAARLDRPLPVRPADPLVIPHPPSVAQALARRTSPATDPGSVASLADAFGPGIDPERLILLYRGYHQRLDELFTALVRIDDEIAENSRAATPDDWPSELARVLTRVLATPIYQLTTCRPDAEPQE